MIYLAKFEFNCKDEKHAGSFNTLVEAPSPEIASDKLKAYIRKNKAKDFFEDVKNIFHFTIHEISGALKTPALLDFEQTECQPKIGCSAPIKNRSIKSYSVCYEGEPVDVNGNFPAKPFITW